MGGTPGPQSGWLWRLGLGLASRESGGKVPSGQVLEVDSAGFRTSSESIFARPALHKYGSLSLSLFLLLLLLLRALSLLSVFYS